MKTRPDVERQPAKYRRLLNLRADLLSLISEMRQNELLKAPKWQIQSLQNSLTEIEQRLGLYQGPRV